jgi:hypothetical protein
MLALSDINPFAAREAKVFAEDKEIIAMSELRCCSYVAIILGGLTSCLLVAGSRSKPMT